jgi:hypothetical protein
MRAPRRHRRRQHRARPTAPPGEPRRAARSRRDPLAWVDRLAARAPWLEGLLLRIPPLARRRAARFSRAEVLGAVPFRNPLIEWEVREAGSPGVEEAVLQVPRRQDRVGRLLNRFFEGPAFRQVVLDELGTDVWRMCDGQASVEALICTMAKKHRLERREVEVSLTMYLRTLARRGFIGLRPAGVEQQALTAPGRGEQPAAPEEAHPPPHAGRG